MVDPISPKCGRHFKNLAWELGKSETQVLWVEVSFTVGTMDWETAILFFDSCSLLIPGSDEFKCQVMKPAGDKGHFLMGQFPRYRWDPFVEESTDKTCDSCAEAAAIYF